LIKVFTFATKLKTQQFGNMEDLIKNFAPGDWDNSDEDGYLDDDLGEGGLFPGDEEGYEAEELEDEI